MALHAASRTADAAKVPVARLRTTYTHLKADERERNLLGPQPTTRPKDAPGLKVREIVRERLDLLLAQGIGDVGHRCHPAAGALA